MKIICGIAGTYNSTNPYFDLKDIIMEQEHRDKDATGIAFLIRSRKPEIFVVKKGIEPKLYFQMYDKTLPATKSAIAIGHNRSATSGNKRGDEEAHPFLSEKKDFALVHNGIVTGHERLRKLLTLHKHNFSSTVDSEVYVHILEDALQYFKDRDKAINFLFELFSGTILILFKDKTLYGMTTNSALEIAEYDGVYYIGSELESVVSKLKGKEITIFTSQNQEWHNMRGYIWTWTVAGNRLFKLYTKKKLVHVELIGDWEELKLTIPEDCLRVRKISCDYCDRLQCICAEVLYGKKKFDKCLDCIKEGIEVPKRLRQSYSRYSPIHSFIETKTKRLTKTKGFVQCGGYDHKVNKSKAVYCTICHQWFCQGCFHDPRRHLCMITQVEPLRALRKNLVIDPIDGLEYFT